MGIKHIVYSGYRDKDSRELKKPRINGDAFYIDDDSKPHYEIRMWTYKDSRFFLCKNRDNEKYTLFSTREELPSGEYLFREPIGYGELSQSLKQYMEIQFDFPRQRVFLSLFPN